MLIKGILGPDWDSALSSCGGGPVCGSVLGRGCSSGTASLGGSSSRSLPGASP